MPTLDFRHDFIEKTAIPNESLEITVFYSIQILSFLPIPMDQFADSSVRL